MLRLFPSARPPASTAGQTLLRLDVDVDGTADYQLKVNGDVTGDSGGWLL